MAHQESTLYKVYDIYKGKNKPIHKCKADSLNNILYKYNNL